MKKTKSITVCALFATLMAIGAFIKIPGPFLPMTLQTFFAVLCGLLLRGKEALISMLVYICMGLIGVPVFSEGGGIGYILKPSFGFILGFGLGAFTIGISLPGAVSGFCRLLVSALFGLIVIYAVGLSYYAWICNVVIGVPIPADKLFLFCFLLPLPGDILSCIFAAVLARRLRPILRNNL